MGYSPWGRKESDTTEGLKHTHTHTNTHVLSGKKELASFKGQNCRSLEGKRLLVQCTVLQDSNMKAGEEC